MSFVVLLNAPPRAGKDTSAHLIQKNLELLGIPSVHKKFSAPLKRAVHEMFGFEGAKDDFFENRKSEKMDELYGMSPREAYIWLSEKVIKPTFEEGFFGKIMANSVNETWKKSKDVVVVSDFGFHIELNALGKYIGPDKLIVVNVHREGCTFDGDSRSYVYPTEEECFDWFQFHNNGTIDELEKQYILPLVSFICETRSLS